MDTSENVGTIAPPSSDPANLSGNLSADPPTSPCCGVQARTNLHHILRYDSNDAEAHIVRVRRVICSGCGQATVVGTA